VKRSIRPWVTCVPLRPRSAWSLWSREVVGLIRHQGPHVIAAFRMRRRYSVAAVGAEPESPPTSYLNLGALRAAARTAP
jgi:hypothetical protein